MPDPKSFLVVNQTAPAGRGAGEVFVEDELDAETIPAAAVAGLVVDSAQIATNVTNIATNVTNIGNNDTDIATNVTNITTNTTAIALALLGLQRAQVQLTAAQVNALIGTNIEIIPAPAAGLAVVPIFAFLFNEFGSAAWVQAAASDAFALKYNGGAEIAELGSEAQMTALIEAVADAPLHVTISNMLAAATGMVPEAATAIDLDNNGATDHTVGTGCTLSVEVWYATVTMASFP